MFLNGSFQEEIFMTQPLDFEHQDTTLVCKLHRASYGLKQAPRASYEKFAQALLMFGLLHVKCEHSLFIYSHQGVTMYALVYVDDILLTGSSSTLIHKLIDSLHATFSLKKLGRHEYFLGIEVNHLPDGNLHLTQTKYIHDLLNRVNMSNIKSVTTPMLSTCKLRRHGWTFKSLILHITCRRDATCHTYMARYHI